MTAVRLFRMGHLSTSRPLRRPDKLELGRHPTMVVVWIPLRVLDWTGVQCRWQRLKAQRRFQRRSCKQVRSCRLSFDLCNVNAIKISLLNQQSVGFGVIVSLKLIIQRFGSIRSERHIRRLLNGDMTRRNRIRWLLGLGFVCCFYYRVISIELQGIIQDISSSLNGNLCLLRIFGFDQVLVFHNMMEMKCVHTKYLLPVTKMIKKLFDI